MTTALSITSVNATTDQLTILEHGLKTGDGAVVLFAPGGDYPGGTSQGQPVWVIRVSNGAIKLASSQANAFAGTAIDITSTGSGTLELRSRWDTTLWAGVMQGPPWVDRNPFHPGDAWQVASGSSPAWRLAGSHPAVTIAANSSVYYPLCIGHRVRPSTGPGLDYPLFRAIEVYGRAFDEAATLSLYVSSGMNSDSVSLSAVTLAGDGPDGPTLSVPVDGLYAARALSLQTPLQLMMGEMLYLRVDTGDGTMDLMTYGIG